MFYYVGQTLYLRLVPSIGVFDEAPINTAKVFLDNEEYQDINGVDSNGIMLYEFEVPDEVGRWLEIICGNTRLSSGLIVELVPSDDAPTVDEIVEAIDSDSEQLRAIRNQLSTSGISTTTPTLVSEDGIEIIQGDDYLEMDNRHISWSGEVEDQWPDLTDAHIVFGIDKTSVLVDCTVVATTGLQQIMLELSKDHTRIPQGIYDYDVQATLSNESVLTLIRGKITVTRSYTN